MRTHAERTLAAEERAVVEGHRARLFSDGKPYVRVKSDTVEGLHYRVSASGLPTGEVVFTCEPESFEHATHRTLVSEVSGHLPCKHCAVAARRLERAGIVTWDGGLWRLTDVQRAVLKDMFNHPADPFKGLPQ